MQICFSRGICLFWFTVNETQNFHKNIKNIVTEECFSCISVAHRFPAFSDGLIKEVKPRKVFSILSVWKKMQKLPSAEDTLIGPF